MDDGPTSTPQRLEGSDDQVLARLHQGLDGDVLRNPPLLNQPAHERVVRPACGGEPDLDLLEAHLDQQVPKQPLALHAHGLEQRLVAVAQVHACPPGGLRNRPVWPLPALDRHGRGRAVLAVGECAHGFSLIVRVSFFTSFRPAPG
jgi:hypothetical protein